MTTLVSPLTQARTRTNLAAAAFLLAAADAVMAEPEAGTGLGGERPVVHELQRSYVRARLSGLLDEPEPEMEAEG